MPATDTAFTGGGDSADVVDAAPLALAMLVLSFQQGSCTERQAAYETITDTVLPRLQEALDVLQDCHDDGCPDCCEKAQP